MKPAAYVKLDPLSPMDMAIIVLLHVSDGCVTNSLNSFGQKGTPVSDTNETMADRLECLGEW